MTMEQLRKAQQAKEFARSSWAERQSVDFEFNTVGTGEALTDPIYFGRAFDRPPAFDFSAVRADIESAFITQSSVAPSPKLTGAYDALRWWGWWEDPQFEVQMRWNDGTIPALNEGFRSGQSISFQKIHWDQTGTVPYPSAEHSDLGEPLFANQWVQSSVGANRWAVVQENGCDKPPRPGPYSAKFTFDGSGESRWLIPIPRIWLWFPGNTYYAPDAGDELIEKNIIGWALDYNYASRGYDSQTGGVYRSSPPSCGRIWVGVNPPNNKWTVRLEVFSTAAAAVQVLFEVQDLNRTHWVTNPASGVSYEFSGGDNDDEIGELVSVELLPGWNSVVAEWKVPSWIMPNVPYQKPSHYPETENDFPWPHFKAKLKATGLAGESVYVARATIEPDWTSKPTVPWLTVGVAEWIQDSRNMYVGAVLWIKSSEVSPSCKGTQESYCQDFRVTSALTLDQHVGLYGLGTGDQIPNGDGFGYVKMNGVTVKDWSRTGSPPSLYMSINTLNPVRIKSIDPPVGQTYHFSIPASTATTVASIGIASATYCGGTLLSGANGYYFSTVDAGDTVTLSVQAKATTTTGAPQLRLQISWRNKTTTSTVSQTFVLTTSYQTFVFSAIAPLTGVFYPTITPVYTTNVAEWRYGAVSCEIT